MIQHSSNTTNKTSFKWACHKQATGLYWASPAHQSPGLFQDLPGSHQHWLHTWQLRRAALSSVEQLQQLSTARLSQLSGKVWRRKAPPVTAPLRLSKWQLKVHGFSSINHSPLDITGLHDEVKHGEAAEFQKSHTSHTMSFIEHLVVRFAQLSSPGAERGFGGTWMMSSPKPAMKVFCTWCHGAMAWQDRMMGKPKAAVRSPKYHVSNMGSQNPRVFAIRYIYRYIMEWCSVMFLFGFLRVSNFWGHIFNEEITDEPCRALPCTACKSACPRPCRASEDSTATAVISTPAKASSTIWTKWDMCRPSGWFSTVGYLQYPQKWRVIAKNRWASLSPSVSPHWPQSAAICSFCSVTHLNHASRTRNIASQKVPCTKWKHCTVGVSKLQLEAFQAKVLIIQNQTAQQTFTHWIIEVQEDRLPETVIQLMFQIQNGTSINYHQLHWMASRHFVHGNSAKLPAP